MDKKQTSTFKHQELEAIVLVSFYMFVNIVFFVSFDFSYITYTKYRVGPPIALNTTSTRNDIADVRLCSRICKNTDFSCRGSYFVMTILFYCLLMPGNYHFYNTSWLPVPLI